MGYLFWLIWCLCGSSGFVFWFTKEWNLTIWEIPLAIGAGSMGPGAWIFGYLVHGRCPPHHLDLSSEKYVLIKRQSIQE